MKISILILFISVINLFSQNDKTDPLRGNYNLGSSSEIAVFWRYQYGAHEVNHNVLDYYGNSGQYFLDTATSGVYTGDLAAGSDGSNPLNNNFEAITGDFNNDGYDNIIAAWQTKNNSISIVIPKNIEKSSLTWNDENVLHFESVLYPDPSFFNMHRFKLVKGYFDGDAEPEFALAFWNKDGNIEIKVFDVDPNTLMPEEKSFIDDVAMDPNLNNAGIYDISAGDFDGDSRDEIVLVYYTEREENDWNISAKIYDYVENNGNFTIVSKAEKDDYFTDNDFFDSWHHVNDLLVSTGDFKNNTLDEFVVDFVLYRNGSETYNKLLPAEVTLNLDSIKVDKNNLEEIFQTLGTQFIAINLVTGDINNDGKDEIVINGHGRLRAYDIDTNLTIQGYTSSNYGYGSEDINRSNLILADLDASETDSVWNPEIIFAEMSNTSPKELTVKVFEPSVDASGDILDLIERASMIIDVPEGNADFYWGLTAGDFDGGSITLGKPKYFNATDIVQPLVILNAPPVHFDKIGENIFDVNNNFNGQSSDFYATYYTASETNIEVESKIHTGWTIGGKVEGGFTIPKIEVGVKIKIEGEYGEDFYKKTTNSKTYRVSQNITASNDDYIYATIIDYDIWEYPVLMDEEIQGYILVVEPGQPQRSWFPSKSPQAAEYIPNHEVGNILSYSDIAAPTENGSLQQVIKWNTSDQITLDGSAGFEYNWSLENETQTETETTNKVHWNVSASASFDIPFKYIPNFEINGDYSKETISTRTNTVKYKKGLDVHLGPIDLGIGETYYSVTPYSYWAKSGALVLDYAVDPRPSGINIPQTWWQKEYSSKPDPALTLPWRLDPEKGYNITEDKKQQTKEIIFSNDNPKPGDIINIKTRIHNYSLLNTNSAVDVKFYLGDPNNGGTVIQSTDGKTIFSTNDFIEARSSQIISFDWQVPNNISIYPRIYVVLDPENKVDEIHEENNIGWKVLPLYDNTTDVETENNLPTKFE
ncbi:MAG: hypothetical protein H6609_20380, partial [Ignavibacteriales bacterium]|nr:hypothetical protein [Ignavibacteriales bacterium]